MTIRWRVSTTMAMVFLSVLVTLAQSPDRIRVIQWDGQIPLVSKLMPGDDIVVVERAVMPPGRVRPSVQSFEAEVTELIRHDAVFVGEAVATGGTLIDQGTWVRGHVTVLVKQLVKGTGDLETSPGTVTFSHRNGHILINGVQVRAGNYPAFQPGVNYLLFLSSDRREGWTLSLGLVVDQKQRLAPLKMSSGAFQEVPSALHGKGLAPVVEALTQAGRGVSGILCVKRS